MQVNLAKLSAALGAGCTTVLKPAPDTPWSASAVGRIIADETDIPVGVVNIVSTSDNAVAQILAEDPNVDIVSFTGSTAVGRRLMACAAPTVKRVFLELGGKSACIVCDDAPLDQVAQIAAYGSCAQAGQGCSINTRLLVQRSVYEETVGKVAAAFEAIPFGDPLDPSVYMGPLINRRQYERVLSYIELGRAEGARLVTGGSRPDGFDKGFFVEPTVFADVDPASRLAQEEIFGPVLCVIPFDDDEQAIDIANGTIYGLAAQVESGSRERADAIARRLRAGQVNVNGGLYHAPDSPFGGYKQSGIGREMGVLGLDEYTEVKVIAYGAPSSLS
jgi:aldehyde dehydrogenase (NAD+)